MKILADENMPLVVKLFSQLGDVTLKHGRHITADDLVDVDVLLVRSITKVNENLLSKANKLTFVGTATAGFDHVDVDYLNSRNIDFTNAKGCNAISVGEYVLSGLLLWCQKYNLNPKDLTLGVIGAGCTGSEVIKRAQALGFSLKICDPIKQQSSSEFKDYVSFSEAIDADIVTFHVPLTKDCEYPTYHMLSKEILASANFKPKFIINASRGEVVDDEALLVKLQLNKDIHVIKDVWEGEPNINVRPLIDLVDIATPHIAGYAYEGKCRGTYMLYEYLAKKLNQPTISFSSLLKDCELSEITINSELSLDLIRRLVHLIYDVRRDDATFRLGFGAEGSFDALRKNYLERRELSSIKINATNLNDADKTKLANLGFSVNQ